jgi:hypothetical protein
MSEITIPAGSTNDRQNFEEVLGDEGRSGWLVNLHADQESSVGDAKVFDTHTTPGEACHRPWEEWRVLHMAFALHRDLEFGRLVELTYDPE